MVGRASRRAALASQLHCLGQVVCAQSPAWRGICRSVVLGLLLLTLSRPEFASAATVSLDVHVNADRWSTTRLRNLPANTLVLVDVDASAAIAVAFVDAQGYRRLPALDDALFQARGDSRFSFSVTTRGAGDHFLVLDNRASAQPRDVKLTIRAARGTNEGTASLTLTAFENSVGRLFVVKPFPIRVKQCGTANAFAGPTGIILCTEYADQLVRTLGDQSQGRRCAGFRTLPRARPRAARAMEVPVLRQRGRGRRVRDRADGDGWAA